MKYLIILFFCFTAFSANAQPAVIVKFDSIQNILKKREGIQVVNFWATWCAPCVKELPLFEDLNRKKKGGINITLINLDFADKISLVNSFLARKKIETKVLLLDELDYNSWIDKVDQEWSGAIPATLILNSKTGKRIFIERELHEGDLDHLIEEIR